MSMPQKFSINKLQQIQNLSVNLGKFKAVKILISISMLTNFKELKSNFGLMWSGFSKGYQLI